MLRALRSIISALVFRQRLESDMDVELGFHMQAFADDLIRKGVDPIEARRRARIEFGSIERTKQECGRRVWLDCQHGLATKT